ncbi:hypothetical protein RHMOL_Rhmol02G0315000 [Rhododendron molle]|uniref:Uncharacterized protein n=1 Tax=Rhododendron molle TaxID=49168 RepID=A0ACC0PXL9_RHOML|nr:hypothetical protein RHMOL_Rhmol02G0315000 [Rhododendron molle]
MNGRAYEGNHATLVAHARSEFASHLFCPELVLDADPTLLAWRKSSNDSLKIKDAAFNCIGFNASGWLFKITGGEIMDGSYRRFKTSTVLQGKLLASRMACVMAKDMGLSNVAIGSDS